MSAATVSIRRAPNLNAGQTIGAGSAGQPFFAKYGTTSSVTQYFQGFSSTYNSLQSSSIAVQQRPHYDNRVYVAEGDGFPGGDDGGLAFYAGQGLHRNYARADFDRTLNYIQSYIYQLPFGKGKRYLNNSRG